MDDAEIIRGPNFDVIPLPDGYDTVTLLQQGFHPAMAVAVGPMRRPIMLINNRWEEISYVR